MSRQANPMMIGGFVLGALILLVMAILVFSSGALFQDKRQFVSYFPGTVQGLGVGARVEFEGVQVGRVTSISLEYDADAGSFRVPVRYEVWADSTKIIGGRIDDIDQAYRMLVEEKGLRAKLQSVSLVTGQYMVSLSLQPNSAIRLLEPDKDIIEIPTIEADRDRLEQALESLDLNQLVNRATGAMDAIHALATSDDLRGLVMQGGDTLREMQQLLTTLNAGLRPLLQRIDDTLADYSALAASTETQVNGLASNLQANSAQLRQLSDDLEQQIAAVSTSAKGTFQLASEAFGSVEELVGERSSMRHEFELLIREAAGAARSLRILADYLQQHPDALIKGK